MDITFLRADRLPPFYTLLIDNEIKYIQNISIWE